MFNNWICDCLASVAWTFSGRLPKGMHQRLSSSPDTETCHPLFMP